RRHNDIEYLKYEANRVQRHASQEIALWREHMQTETGLPRDLLKQLDQFSEPLSPREITRWNELRVEMEYPIRELTGATRNENKVAGKRRDSSLRIDVREDIDVEDLERFAKTVVRKYKQSLKAGALKSSA